MRAPALDSAAKRVAVLGGLLLATFLLLGGRAVQLALANDAGRELGNRQLQTRITLAPARGSIFDREERELAISVLAPSVYVLPDLLQDRARSVSRLARALGLDRRALDRRIASHHGFTYVARWLDEETARRITALDLPGVEIATEPRRTYPAGRLAASLLGFADIDGNGVRGVEQMMDSWLKGERRTLALQRDARGHLLSNRAPDPRLSAGGDVMLTIDAGLQAEAEAALADAVERHHARAGVVIVMDPSNGDVLSLAEQPGFDPNDFRHVDYRETRSRAFLDACEPGSTLKAFLVAGALDAGALTPHDSIDTGNGELRLRGKTIRDHRPSGVLDPAGVLRISSNVGAALIAQQLGAKRHHDALRRFGFGRPTESGFPSESAGLLRDWRAWKPIDQATAAFGQGLGVTPIQLASALAALANGGELMRPRLVLARRSATRSWQRTQPRTRGRAVRPKTARALLEMLETVVSAEGTGRLAALAGVAVAGKTGTAQKFDSESGHYSNSRYTAWFMGVIPADAPKRVIVVAIDEPSGHLHSGGSVAAPVFARIATHQLARLGIVTRPAPIPAAPRSVVLLTSATHEARAAEFGAGLRPDRHGPGRALRTKKTIASRRIGTRPASVSAPSPRAGGADRDGERLFEETVLVPDFRGRSQRAARRLAANESLDLRVAGSGAGLVIDQSPRPGTIVHGDRRTIILRFRGRKDKG